MAKRARQEYALPKAPTTPSDRLEDYVTLLFGEKKIGKTTLTSHFGKSFHAMFEPGGKALEIYQEPMQTWGKWLSYIRLLENDTSFRTVVVDTVDIAYRLAAKYVCDKQGIDHLSDEDFGKGYDMARQEFTLAVNRLIATGKGIIFISHSQQKEVKRRSGDRYDRIVSTMPNQARDILDALVDIWAYYYYDGTERKLQIRGDELVAAGHRLENHFRYTDGTEISVIPMGSSSLEAYNNFMLAWSNKLQRKGGDAVSSPKETKFKKVLKRRNRVGR